VIPGTYRESFSGCQIGNFTYGAVYSKIVKTLQSNLLYWQAAVDRRDVNTNRTNVDRITHHCTLYFTQPGLWSNPTTTTDVNARHFS